MELMLISISKAIIQQSLETDSKPWPKQPEAKHQIITRTKTLDLKDRPAVMNY
jgi:hypothetical protein